MNARKIIIILIIIICLFALGYGVYFQVFEGDQTIIEPTPENTIEQTAAVSDDDFNKLFDNQMNYQGYSANVSKTNQTKELVYTNYTLTEIYEGKYDIKANIPSININNSNASKINKEINTIFQEKVNSIIANKDSGNTMNVYTVDYTAYLNENILSIVIKSTLKEGGNVQRLMIKAYTYNISTNEEITLSSMLNIKGIDSQNVEKEVKKAVQESISRTDNLAALGYDVYERDINSTMYTVANSNNYFLGPNEKIYIIYAYGNTSFTSEKDIIAVE